MYLTATMVRISSRVASTVSVRRYRHDSLFSRMTTLEPNAGVVLSTCPCSPLSRIDESAAARICREAGGRVATNMFVRNMDLGAPNAADNRRLELPLFGGVQLQWTTLVSAVQGDGVPRRGAANRDGVALTSAPGARVRLVVLALEVGGRWSQEASTFVKLLAKAKVRSELAVVQRPMEAWRLRWSQVARKGQGEVRASCGATPNGGVEAPVEFDPGVRCCTRLCRFSSRTEGRTGCGWPGALFARG